MTTRPELILCLNAMLETVWNSEDELLEFLQEKAPDLADAALLRRAIDYAVTVGVLTRTGSLIVRRRLVTEKTARDFEEVTADMPTTPGVDVGQLSYLARVVPQLDSRVRSLEGRVDDLGAACHGGGHWLQLHAGQMPRPLYGVLKARAIMVLGKDATEQAIATQMTLVAAQILQVALRPEQNLNKV